ncbi:MAG TPA: outer membrane beta-barrel protein [Moraxellaceae bacterium]|nr:outer membrane beta-barrel protein [Moraxellaceae bacterium]
MKLNKLSFAILGVTALAGSAQAATPTLKDVLGASGITASGYVDAAYTSFDTDAGSFSTNYFDSSSRQTFEIKQASVTFASQPAEGFGALVNVTGGNDAQFIHSAGGSTADFDLTQAFVQYATGNLTVMGGKFVTLAGAEVIAPTGNTNISRSMGFLNALPFTHTGVRVSYAPAKTVTLYAGVNNGWDQATDSNNGKTLELGVSVTPADILSAGLYAYRGDEGVAPAHTLTLIDAVVTIKPVAPLAIVLNYDTDTLSDGLAPGQDASWSALSGYLNYQFTDKLRTSLRVEQFDDKDGFKFGAADNKIMGYTLTVGYAPETNFELRGEVRQDQADKKVYTKDGSATDTQTYFAVEGLYKF